MQLAVGAGELAAEARHQVALGVLRGQRGDEGREAVVQRQFGQRPGGAALAPGGFQARVQFRRQRVAGVAGQVVATQVGDQLGDRLGRQARDRLGRRRVRAAAGRRHQQGGRQADHADASDDGHRV
ncbi:hypothetical protein [Lysobacter capsici]|uniref:hypothetical protein n=1 Tax=Lysobacter capsici TaxID=435897 RepID=UPI00398CFD0C